jgi:hypothetical protein
MEGRASSPAWSERSSTARQVLAASEKSAELTLGLAGKDTRLSIESSPCYLPSQSHHRVIRPLGHVSAPGLGKPPPR